MAKMTKRAKANPTTTARKVVLPKPRNNTQYTQSEFFDCIREFCMLENRKSAKNIYAGFANLVQQALKKGYKLAMPGIGKLQVRHSKPRIGRNPKTGEPMKIGAKKRIRLTPSKVFKEAVL